MNRIAFLTREAILAVLGIIVSIVFIGCYIEGTTSPDPKLIIYPSTGMAGESLAINIGVDGAKWSQCSRIDADSLEFSGGESEKSITVYSVERQSKDILRGSISIPKEASNSYIVAFNCNENTKFRGKFHVTSSRTLPTLELSPAHGAAGSINKEIMLKVEGDSKTPFFTKDSFVLFGDSSFVTVIAQTVIDDYEMKIVVDIARQAPEREVEVTAITGAKVVRGVFNIQEKADSRIWVEPEVVDRPTLIEGTAEYELEIRGVGIDFVAPLIDSGLNDEGATRVKFPENPGVYVERIEVDEESLGEQILRATIAVDNAAKLGITPLVVETGSHSVKTSFALHLASGIPYIRVQSPLTVSKSGEQENVFLEAINFSFENIQRVDCLEAECFIDWYRPTSKKMFLLMRVLPSFSGEKVTLEVVTAEHQVQQNLTVEEPVGLTIKPDPSTVKQGRDRPTMVAFNIEGDEFVSEPVVKISGRSGMAISEKWKFLSSNKYSIGILVADDAPVGPAQMEVFVGDKRITTILEVIPNGPPSVSLFPQSLLRRRGIVFFEIDSIGVVLDADPEHYIFDDPSLQVLDVRVSSERNQAELEVSVSPEVKPGVAVLYVHGVDGKAAASVRILDMPKPRLTSVEPKEIVRANGDATITIGVEGMHLDQAVVQHMLDIGIDVKQFRVDRYDSQKGYIDLEVDEDGPQGWTGLVLHGDGQDLVIPILMNAGGDDPLTAYVYPKTIKTGSSAVNMKATLPTQARIEDSCLDIYTDSERAFTSSATKLEESQVGFTLDVALDVEEQVSRIPLYIMTANGASVGFVEVEHLDSTSVTTDVNWEESLQQEERKLLTITPTSTPVLVRGSVGTEGHADVALEMVSENNLDIAERSDTGLLWVLEQGIVPVFVSRQGESDELTSTVEIEELGMEFLQERSSESEDENLPEWDFSGPDGDNPCNSPLLIGGRIENAFDDASIYLGQTQCDLVAVALARSLANRPWLTPDLWMELQDSSGQRIEDFRAIGWPDTQSADPKLYIHAGQEDAWISIGSELGSSGEFFVNIRQAGMIREFSRSPKSPFIEIGLQPKSSFDGLALELVDAERGTILSRLVLDSTGIVNDGIIVIGGASMSEADIVHPVAVFPDEGPFVIRLVKQDVTIDSVQLGEGLKYGEGRELVDDGETPVYFRVGGIDTNDNQSDFLGSWIASPGQ